VDCGSVVEAFVHWDGPEDIDLGGYEHEEAHSYENRLHLRKYYGQTGLAVVYATDPTRDSLEGSFQITLKVAKLLHIDPDFDISIDIPSLSALHLDLNTISQASKASLLQNTLLAPSNPLTVPTTQSVAFLQAVLISLRILREYEYRTSCRSAATICLQSSDEAQSLELRGVVDAVIKHTIPGRHWEMIREQILWLRDWRVSREVVETEILRAMMDVGGK
jgi:hypothetical protein